jgi:hypothetical protein
MTDAYRACPLCGTRNTYYMLVCRHCGRSLRGVALVGTPPPGTVVDTGARRGLRLVGVLALLAAAGAAAVAYRLLRTSHFEAAAAASDEAAPSPEPTPQPVPTAWETLEQRLAALPPAPVPSSAPSAAPAATLPPPPTTAPPPPTTLAATPRPRPVPSRPPEDAEAQARALRAARKAALHDADERVRTLERQADDLRERLHGEDVTDDQRRQLEDTLASVLLQIEDAERALVRAEWALREVEE